ncbi:MAG TPA: ABC transporter substrate-binding protein [Anaerolineales bacterium]|nr:ABC transporter substrate-binding protein [Anaerolineales bacterium]
MFKKLYPIFAVLIGLLLALSACNSANSGEANTANNTANTTNSSNDQTPEEAQDEPAEPVKLTFWNNWDNVNMEVMTELVDAFNTEHPNIQVENVFQPYAEMMTLLQASIASGKTPDIAAVDLIFLPQLVETSGVLSLDDFIANEAGFNVDDFYPLLASYDVIDGSRYALPVSTNNMQVIWNKDLFAAAGLDPEMPPATWEEMQAMSEQCQNLDEGIVGFEFYTQPIGEGITWQFQVWLWAAGGEFLNADNTAAAFNTPEGLQALSFVSDMLQGNGSQPGPWGLFGEQKACMQLDGSWLFGYRSGAPFEWGIAQVPAPADGTTASNVGGEHIFIFKDSPNQEAAWEFVKYITNATTQITWDMKTGFLPVRASVAENQEYLDWINDTEPRMLPFVDGMPFAHTRPATPKYTEVSEAFSREIQQALLGEISPEEALINAESAVNAILAP